MKFERKRKNGELPTFFNYEAEGKTDQGHEALMDFFLSWTLRCADDKNKSRDSKVHQMAKKILFTLLFSNAGNDGIIAAPEIKFESSFKVMAVKTYRQKNSIDLLVEVKCEIKKEQQAHVICIENKWYSDISENQLPKYKDYVEQNYPDQKKQYIVLFLDSSKFNVKNKNLCKEYGYILASLEHIMDIVGIKEGCVKEDQTGNELFDTFWF